MKWKTKNNTSSEQFQNQIEQGQRVAWHPLDRVPDSLKD